MGRIIAPSEDAAGAFVEICRRVADFCRAQEVVGSALPAGSERVLARVGWIFSQYESIYRSREGHAGTVLVGNRTLTKGDDLLALANADQQSLEDLVALAQLFTSTGLPLMRSLGGSGTVNPMFVEGYADAPLLMGDCLIEIKSVARNAFDAMWIRQLLGYALLDVDDLYGVRRVGVYLSRHGRLLTWELESLLPDDCKGGALSPSTRAAFLRLVTHKPATSARNWQLGRPENTA